MHLSVSTIISALLVGAASVSASTHVARHGKRHHELAAREPEPIQLEERVPDGANGTEFRLDKRQDDARFTFYDVGLGACGITNGAGDFIVALNKDQYGDGFPGPQCFKMITISYGGKTANAQITDLCPGCPYRGLDMSRGLFTYFAAESEGVIYGNWWFSDGGNNNGGGNQDTTTTSKSKKPKSTSTWVPPSTSSSEWTPPTTTWSSSSETSTWSSSSSWSSSSEWSSSSWSSTTWSSSSSAEPTTSYDLSSGAASGLAVATGSGALSVPTASANIYNMNMAIIDMGALINAGAQLN